MKARVQNGRIVVEEPTALPEGAEVDVELLDEDDLDEIDDDERAALEAALDESEEDVAAGRVHSAEEVLASVRQILGLAAAVVTRPLRLSLSTKARRQIEAVAAWWRAQGLGSPEVFEQELAGVLALLIEMPSAGRPYPSRRHLGVRTILLRRSRYHLYYTIDDKRGELSVRAIRHAARPPAVRYHRA